MDMKTILRRVVFVGIFAIPFIPFLVTPSMLFPFITGKNFIFRIIVEIIFGAWVLLAIKDAEFRPKFSWLLVAMTSFVAIVGIADIFAENPYKAFWSNFERMEGFITTVHLYLYFLVLSSTFSIEKWWNRLFSTWVGSSVLMCLFSLLQVAGKATINQGGVRVDGKFGNASYLAVFLLFNIFFGAFLFLRARDKKVVGWTIAGLSILELAILYLTATRGAILGLIGGVLVTVLLTALFDKESKYVRKISVAVLIVVVAIVALFVAVRRTPVVQNSPVLSRFANLSLSEIKTQGRYYIWPMAIEGSKERPILGWGQEGFSYVFNENYNPKMYTQEQWFDRAHSAPLDWLIASGILGFLAYVSVIFFSYWYIWKRNIGDYSVSEKSLLTGLLSAYVFQSIFVFDNLLSYVLFFSVVALIQSRSVGIKLSFFDKFGKSHIQSAVAVVLTILLVLSVYFLNWKPIRASQHLIKALVSMQNALPTEETLNYFEKAIGYDTFANTEIREQLVSAAHTFLDSGVSPQLRDRYLALTTKEINKQVEETPNDARYLLFKGVFLRSVGQYEEAVLSLNKALEFSPQKQTIIFELGATYINKKDFKTALSVFKRAYDLEPSYGDAALLYGISAIYAGDTALADKVCAGISQARLYQDDRLVSVLVDVGRWNEIVKIFTFRIANGGDNVDNNMALAVAYLKTGNREQSISVLKRLSEKSPDIKEQIDYYISEIKAGRDPSTQ